MKLIYITTILFFICVPIVWAQQPEDIRPDDKDIQIEKLFIEATKERILQNYDQAISKYLEVIQTDNTNAMANYELAKLYEQEEQYDKAEIRAEQAHKLEPKNLVFGEQYALVLEKTGNLKEAAELYGIFVNEYPKEEHLYYKQAYFLTKIQKQDQAIKVYNNLEKQVGVKEPISMRKYKLYMVTNKAKKAGQELIKLQETYPREPEFMLRLANYYVQIRDYTQANNWYKKTLEIDSQNPTANIALVEYFIQNGDTARYLNALMPIFADASQGISAKHQTLEPLVTGLLEGQYTKYEEPISKLTQTLTEAHPTDAKSNWMQAELLYKAQKYREAESNYLIAIQKEKNNIQLWQRLLDCLYQNNNRKGLLTKSQEAMDLYPSQPYGYYYNGIALLQSQKYQEAAKRLADASDIAVTDAALQSKAQSYLGQAYSYLNDTKKAEKAFKEALEKMPNNPDIKQIYAQSLAIQGGDLNKALSLADEAIGMDQNKPAYYSTKGYILYKQGQYTLAQQSLDKALSLGGSENPQILEYYGDNAFKLGKKEVAATYWQKALDKGATSEILKRKVNTGQLYE